MNRYPVKKGDKLKIYVDGASRGNPGPAARPFLLVHNDNIIHDECLFIGTATNNNAEYQAIINALKAAEKFSRGHTNVHREVAPGDHWYLQTLGVEPAHQGNGYGSLLMEYMLEKIDNSNPLPIFLETSTEINVKFYKRFGFEVMEEGIIPETDVEQWYLLRNAK